MTETTSPHAPSDARAVALRQKVQAASAAPATAPPPPPPAAAATAPAGSMLAKIQYARALADSGLLPAAYRRHPENVLWAIEYGEMLGLSPMAAITGIHVIEGKPSASAALISALVRRAGHKLRVYGDAKSATCEIIRSDDPDYVFKVTFSLTDAVVAGLSGKSTWKQYPGAMLKARAITQCARDACEEALFGLHYTPEELGADITEDGDVVAPPAEDRATIRLREMYSWFSELFADDDPQAIRDMLSGFCERPITISTDLTPAEVDRILDELRDLLSSASSPEDAAQIFRNRYLPASSEPPASGDADPVPDASAEPSDA